MASNHFGKSIRLTSFGESHGAALGGVLDGLPSGVEINIDSINVQLQRRQPGQSNLTTTRNEPDKVEFLSGIFENKSTGTPIAWLVRNKDQKSSDYDEIKRKFRPSHADFTYTEKYGTRDHRGGGRASARETLNWVVAGSIVRGWLKDHDISICAFTSSIGKLEASNDFQYGNVNLIEQNLVHALDQDFAMQAEKLIEKTKKDGDSLGGTISCVIEGCPVGLGEPIFDKINARLAQAMFGLNAVKGFEIGGGFEMTAKKGSEVNDAYFAEEGRVKTVTNYSGGIQGGISNGMPITFKVGFKPTATIAKTQETVNTDGENTLLAAKGRHDPCVVPRAVVIVESLAALVIADFIQLKKLNKI